MTTQDTLPARMTARERAVVAVLLTAGFTLAVDFSILNVALPVIGADVGFSTGSLQWIATSFALAAAGCTLFFGRVADLAGRRRLFLLGMALLGASSLAGGLAQGPGVLLAARVAQGLATAMVTPSALALLTTGFPAGPARDRVLGLNGALMAAGFTTGALLGGLLTGTLNWRWAFFLNVVVAAAVLAVAPLVLGESRAERRPRLDVAGAATVTLALVALVFGASSAGEHGWGDPRAWGALAVAAALLGVFGLVEARAGEPLVALGVLRRRPVAWGNAAGFVAFATETSLVFALTLYLQDVLGFSPLVAGLAFAVLGAGTVLGGLIAPRVIAAVGAGRAIALGLAVQAAATLPLAFAGEGRGWLVPLLALTFTGGVANLVAIVGYVVTATSGLPAADQGLASGLVTLSQQTGIALGTPLLAAVITARLDAGTLPALHTAFTVNALTTATAATLLALALRRAPSH
ncbi:MFS transporter [Actinocorallia sp. API 0066]|uniref:MFS transporter n=1 Tax=Actinocorallia sp. API 0066 TaxID=2896846 RepID=UPI001E360277|nr:MFS transporter [Actinocorallia sp. API 0066]MCD0453208.1 MFS transporter [Actinocorallia sp. API 0066]